MKTRIFLVMAFSILLLAAVPAAAQQQITVTKIIDHSIDVKSNATTGETIITHTLKNVYEGANVTDITITDYLPLATTTQQNATEADYQGAKWKSVTSTISQLAPNEEKIISYNVTLPAGKNRLLLGRRIYSLGGQLEAGPQEKFVEVAGGIQILWLELAAAMVIIAAAIYVLKGKKRKTQHRVKN